MLDIGVDENNMTKQSILTSSEFVFSQEYPDEFTAATVHDFPRWNVSRLVGSMWLFAFAGCV